MSLPALDPYAETSYARARRSLHTLVTSTIRFAVWFAFVNAAVVGATSYLSWGHQRSALVAIDVGAFVAGSIAAFVLPLTALWVIAPVRQRNEARAALAEAIALNEEPTGIARCDFQIGKLWSFADPKNEEERILLLDLRFTNRQPEDRINLNPELMTQATIRGQPIGKPYSFLRRFDTVWKKQLHPPLNIGPQETVDGPLVFRWFVHERDLRYGGDGKVYVERHTNVFLRLEDHVSGQMRDVPLELPEWQEAEERTREASSASIS
jgi:hypothetical protein